MNRVCGCGYNPEDDDICEECTGKGILNHVSCPPSKMLTKENEPSSVYFDYDSSEWIRHWCFLGELVANVGFVRPGFMLKTRFGDKFQVHFYMDKGEKPTTFGWRDCAPGHTMAILYAERKTFLDLQHGIRQEVLDSVFVFKAPLKCVVKCASVLLQNKTCFGCAKQDQTDLKFCAKCRIAAYCSRECQALDWKSSGEGKHSRLCPDITILQKLNACLDLPEFQGFKTFKSL